MLKKVLVKGLFGVAGFMATKAILDRLDLSDMKRKGKSKKVIDLREDEEFPTEEDVQFMKKLSEMNMA